MLILREIERNEDPKTRKARKAIRKYNIRSAIDIATIKRGTKGKHSRT